MTALPPRTPTEQRDAARPLHEPIPGLMPPACLTCMVGTDDLEADPLTPRPWPCPTAWALGADPTHPYTEPWGTQ